MEGNCPPALRSRRDYRSSGLRFYLAEYSDQFLLCRDGARLVGSRLVIRRLQQLMKRSLWKMARKQRRKLMANLKKEDYGFFFASAGHSALYDYPTAKGLQAIAADIWDRGGIVGAVCHGPAIMPDIIDSKTGKSIIHGKTVTGFTIEGELIFRILDKLRADGVVPIVEAVTAAGAFYSGSVGRFDDSSITSGRVVTGTNPASGRSATERGVKLFDNLELP